MSDTIDPATSPGPGPDPGEVTRLLLAAAGGGAEALGELFPLVYDELRRLAEAHFRRERADHTLQPTALVHEVYAKLLGQETAGWATRAQFYGVAAQAMRRILVDHARVRRAAKRGGHAVRVPLSEAFDRFERRAHDVEALHEALERLAVMDEQMARIVELRFFVGLSHEEVAALLDLAPRTARRQWAAARAWLRAELDETGSEDARHGGQP